MDTSYRMEFLVRILVSWRAVDVKAFVTMPQIATVNQWQTRMQTERRHSPTIERCAYTSTQLRHSSRTCLQGNLQFGRNWGSIIVECNKASHLPRLLRFATGRKINGDAHSVALAATPARTELHSVLGMCQSRYFGRNLVAGAFAQPWIWTEASS